jgi:transposase
MMDEVAKRVTPEEIWVVADGAMLTEDNRKILKEAKAGYVLGASVKKLSQVHQEEALNLASFKDFGEGKKYRTIDLKSGNTVIVTWSELKAKRDIHKREQLIKKLLKKLDKKGEIQTKTIIGNRGTSKYIEPSDGQEECKYRLNQEKIEEDSRYDGLHAVETDRQVKNEEDVYTVLNAYGNLWHIEDCFRVSKSDIEIRPMYHWTSERIESHVAICFLSLLMERYLQSQLKVRRRQSMSAQCIKDALSKVNSTLIKDTEQDKLYRFPSRLSREAREIYKALGLKRGVEATEITSVVNYRRRIPNIRGEVYEEEEEGNNPSRV